MIEQLNTLIKEAMKAKNQVRLQALRYMKSLLMENKTSKNPGNELDVIIKHHKKLNDSLELYQGQEDKISDIKAEMDVVAEFLPQAMTEEEVVAIIESIVAANAGANMGVVMKELQPQIKGRFDGKRASQLVKEKLA